MLDLLLVHVAGADRPDIAIAFQHPHSERHKDMPRLHTTADGEEPYLIVRMGRVRPDSDLAGKQPLDLGEGDAMTLTLIPGPRPNQNL